MNICNKKLEVKNITAGYNDIDIIKDINLEVYENEIISIIGLSGVGKSTIFNVISGLLKPKKGKVLLNGKDITNKSGYLSYMLQKDLLLPFKTVGENIALPLIIKGEKKKYAIEKVKKYLPVFGLDNTIDKYPKELSGGMKQRAAFLRTYLFSAEVALLDEPFSALDYITKLSMHKWYLNIMKKIKMATIFITHDIDEAITLSDKIYILKGKPSTLTTPIKVNISKPKSNLNSDFIQIKKKILENLK